MNTKLMKRASVLGVIAVGACAVCVVPLAIPIVVGVFGVGALGAGYGLLGAALVAAGVGVMVMRSKKKPCICAATSGNGVGPE